MRHTGQHFRVRYSVWSSDDAPSSLVDAWMICLLVCVNLARCAPYLNEGICLSCLRVIGSGQLGRLHTRTVQPELDSRSTHFPSRALYNSIIPSVDVAIRCSPRSSKCTELIECPALELASNTLAGLNLAWRTRSPRVSLTARKVSLTPVRRAYHYFRSELYRLGRRRATLPGGDGVDPGGRHSRDSIELMREEYDVGKRTKKLALIKFGRRPA